MLSWQPSAPPRQLDFGDVMLILRKSVVPRARYLASVMPVRRAACGSASNCSPNCNAARRAPKAVTMSRHLITQEALGGRYVSASAGGRSQADRNAPAAGAARPRETSERSGRRGGGTERREREDAARGGGIAPSQRTAGGAAAAVNRDDGPLVLALPPVRA
jgi:hypothetical protein